MLGVNNNIICKPHNLSGGLKSEVKSGFAFVQNKTDIVALKVLSEGEIVEGSFKRTILANSTIYVKEERLTTMPWGKTVFKLAGEEVILIPGNEVIAIENPTPEEA
jgi:hypothetical protein